MTANTYLVHVVNLWNGESSNECCKQRKDVSRKGRHTLVGTLREREAGMRPCVCTYRKHVAGRVSMLMHTRQVHFYVVAGTVCKISVIDVTLKIEVILSMPHGERIQNSWISCDMLRRQESLFTCPRVLPFSPSVLRKLKRAAEVWYIQGPVSRKSRKVFTSEKPWQNLKPYDYRAVLFTYS